MFKEYSKQMTFWILVFCAVAATSIIVGWYCGLPRAFELLVVVGSIATIAVIYYTTKARDENLEKIKKNGILSTDEIAMIIKIKECSSTSLLDNLTKIASSTEIGG